jgi:hypothetical protein
MGAAKRNAALRNKDRGWPERKDLIDSLLAIAYDR